jgi:hypothetical protein
MDKNTTHLAGEFLAAGELSRRGLAVSITFGNAKSIDIFAQSKKATYRVDAKALRSKSNWPISPYSIDKSVYYVFVFLGTEKQISEGASPEYFVVTGADLIENGLITQWRGNRSGVTYKALCDLQQKNPWSVFK